MALPSLSWGRYIAIVLLYWVLVVGGWMFYTTRPSDSTSDSRTSRDRRTKGSRHRRDDPDTLIYNQSPANWRSAFRPATGALDRMAGASQAVSRAGLLPNKRLKLAGADRSEGTGVLCPWRGTDFVLRTCAGERVARSLSAIR